MQWEPGQAHKVVTLDELCDECLADLPCRGLSLDEKLDKLLAVGLKRRPQSVIVDEAQLLPSPAVDVLQTIWDDNCGGLFLALFDDAQHHEDTTSGLMRRRSVLDEVTMR